MFKLTIRVASTTTIANLNELQSYEFGLTQFFTEFENVSIYHNLTNQTPYTSNEVHGN